MREGRICEPAGSSLAARFSAGGSEIRPCPDLLRAWARDRKALIPGGRRSLGAGEADGAMFISRCFLSVLNPNSQIETADSPISQIRGKNLGHC